MKEAKSVISTAPSIFNLISDAPIHVSNDPKIDSRHKLFRAILKDDLDTEIRYVAVQALMMMQSEVVPSFDSCVKNAIIAKYFSEVLKGHSRSKASAMADEIFEEDLMEFVTLLPGLPFHRDETERMRGAYRDTMLEILSSPVLRMDDHRTRHILDTGYSKMSGEQRVYLENLFSNRLYADEVENSAFTGFKSLAQSAISMRREEQFPVLRWYIEQFHLNDKYNGKETAETLYQLSRKGYNYRDALLIFYEENADILDPILYEYPEFDFIVHGKYKRYKFIDAIAKQMEISMQDYAVIAAFFKNLNRSAMRNDMPGKKVRKKAPSITPKQHREAIISTMDHLNRVLIHRKINTAIINIWPNEVKDERTAQAVGPYIAVAFKYQSKWWLLVDSFRQQSAIYLWTGKRLSDGLALMKEARTYVRGRVGVRCKNHTPLYCSYFDSYYKLIKNNGFDILG